MCFRSPFIDILTPYLSGSQQLVKIDDAKIKLVTYALFILGPFLFNLYGNEIGTLQLFLASTRRKVRKRYRLVFFSENGEYEDASSFQNYIIQRMASFISNRSF